MSKKLLCILFGNGGTAPNLLYDGLNKLDSEFVIFYIKPKSESLKKVYDEWFPKFGDFFEVQDYFQMQQEILKYNNEIKKIDGIITFSEKLLNTASKVAVALKLPYNSVSSIENTQNKFVQRKLLEKNNIPIPKYYLIKDTIDLDKAVDHVGFPAVLKPVYGSGSYFVQSIKSKEQLLNVYENTSKDYVNLLTDSLEEGYFLLEEEMVGENYHNDSRYGDYASVESVIFDGEVNHLCIVDRMPLAKPFRETGFLLPSNLPSTLQKEMFDIAEKSIQSLKLTYGFTHIEFKFTSEGPKVIEVNARPGGGFPYRLGLAAPDYDLFYEFGKISLNMKPNSKPNFISYAGSIIVQGPDELLKIKSISGTDSIRNIREVDLSIVVAKEGDLIDPRLGLQNILAFFYLKGSTHEEIFLAAKKLKREFQIEFIKN